MGNYPPLFCPPLGAIRYSYRRNTCVKLLNPTTFACTLTKILPLQMYMLPLRQFTICTLPNGVMDLDYISTLLTVSPQRLFPSSSYWSQQHLSRSLFAMVALVPTPGVFRNLTYHLVPVPYAEGSLPSAVCLRSGVLNRWPGSVGQIHYVDLKLLALDWPQIEV